MKAHYVCSVCSDLFVASESGMREATEKELRIENHVFQPHSLYRIEASCLKYGTDLSIRICQNCGKWENWDDDTGSHDRGIKYATAYRNKHAWGEPIYLVEPTCTSGGLYYCICKVCQATKETYVDQLEHNYRTISEVTPATCTENGLLIEQEICTGCGRSKGEKKETVIEATGHDYDNGTVTIEPGCTEDGEMTYTCRNDHTHIRTETINKTGHKAGEWELKPVPASACTDKWTEARILRCIRCDEIIEKHEDESDPLGHAWDDPVYEWAPDNSTVSAAITCARSEDHGIQETVNTSSVITKEPSKSEEGIRTYTAKFTDPLFETQTRTETIPKLEPDEYKITFDLKGGTLNNQSGRVVISCKEGVVITLPLPVKSGYDFDHWEGSRYNAGDKYTVTEDHTFTAVWKVIPADDRSYHIPITGVE